LNEINDLQSEDISRKEENDIKEENKKEEEILE